MTKKQWIVILILLALNVVWVYGGVASVAVTLNPYPNTLVAEELSTEVVAEAETPGAPSTARPPATASRVVATAPRVTPSPSATPSPRTTGGQTATIIATPTTTPQLSRTPPPTRRSLTSAAAVVAPGSLARLELDPRSRLVRKVSFFTSACFGQGANPLQDRDFMAPADWTGSPDRKCIFGFGVNPTDGMPTGRYSVQGVDGQPRFYIIPPDAFAHDQRSIKQLSQMHLIVDTDQGCDALGSFGVTADGVTFQCPACTFLRSGGVCSGSDPSKSIILPANKNNVLDANDTGGAYGFVGFPLVLFRKGFSLYFTGKSGYAPPRTWFESGVDTLFPNVNVKTTAEMTNREIKDVANQFDSQLTGASPPATIAPLEQEVAVKGYPYVILKPKEKGGLYFDATPGTVLSSITWKITPLSNTQKRMFMETNLCLTVNGEQTCFTGVEDFAHCAFYSTCRTGFSYLDGTAGSGYLATRYFLPGAAPVITDSNITADLLAPDSGTVIESEVKVRVRTVDLAPR